MLPKYFTSNIIKWLPLLLPELITISKRYPMVSGLYRIITTVFKVITLYEGKCSKHHTATTATATSDPIALVPPEFNAYLQQLKHDDANDLSAALLLFTSNDSLHQLLKLMTSFLRDVQIKMTGYSDELLSSVLYMVMQAPRVVISRINQLAGSISLALKTGFQVDLALRTLDKFIHRDEQQRQALLQYLPDILILLDGYLVVPDSKSGQIQSMKFKSKMATKLNFMYGEKNQSDLMNIQSQVLRLLGRLGGDNQMILQSPDISVQASLSWASKEFLVVKLPLPGVYSSVVVGTSGSNRQTQRLAIQSSSSSSIATEVIEVKVALDRLLPRIIEICTTQSSATDRQAKLAAAEALHAVLVLLIGNGATSPERIRGGKEKRESELSQVYLKLFPAVIELSVDSDLVCRKLFNKLLFQIIHWFSGFNQVYEDESEVLIDSLVVGLCTSLDSSVRDQCANGLSVFFDWSIKQSTKKELEQNKTPADELLNKLFVIAVHPSEHYKVGALKVINSIYKSFREESGLMRRHALQIVYVLMKSVRQAGASDAVVQVRIVTCCL